MFATSTLKAFAFKAFTPIEEKTTSSLAKVDTSKQLKLVASMYKICV